jgi:serine phosphatase RsbU (regulator of sigma subunit)
MSEEKAGLQPRSLMKQVEQLVDSIESASGAESVVELASEVVSHFGAELGLTGGRVYARDGADYVLKAAFPDRGTQVEPIRVPETYPPLVQLLERGFVFMGPDDPGVDPELEKRLGARTFAAIWVGREECDCILSFDVAPDSQNDDIRYSLSILRHSINHRLREAWVGNVFGEARLIQTSILPRKAPQFDGFDIAGRSDPMEFVGGDYFDYIQLSPKILGLAIADASGHGLPAALQVRDIYMGLRMGLSHEFKILPTVERLNEIVGRATLTSRFVSLFYGEIELNGNFLYVNAGHPFPLHIRRDGEVRRLRRGGAVLGPIPGGVYERGFVRLRHGDTLVLYTDGIVETEGNTARGIEEYGEHRLISQVMECAPLSAAETVEAVFEDVEKFDLREQQQDDRTLVIIRGPR